MFNAKILNYREKYKLELSKIVKEKCLSLAQTGISKDILQMFPLPPVGGRNPQLALKGM